MRDGVEHLAFGDVFTAAYDTSIARITQCKCDLFLRGKRRKMDGAWQVCDKIVAQRQFQPLIAQYIDKQASNGGRGGQPRRLDARGIDKAALGGRANDKVFAGRRRVANRQTER